MRSKDNNTTGPPNNEKQSKRLFKSKKETPTQAAKKFESNLPEVAKRNNIRVSSPYGYLTNQLEDYKSRANAAQNELSKLKMQISLMEIPDTSTEENFAMLSRISTITGNNEEQIQNNIIKSPKTHNINIIKSPNKNNTITSNNDKPKKSSAVISLNINKKEK